MLPATRSGRSAFACAGLLLATLTAGLAVRGRATPYIPKAPAYRINGPAGTPVVILEYSDFQCPACQAAVDPLKNLQKLFPGKIRVIFMHFPWDFHPWARDGAIAAECAGRGGDFWGFHDALFGAQSAWTDLKDKSQVYDTFSRMAAGLGIEETSFRTCLADAGVGAGIDAELKDAKAHWVGSTPTFFINGKRFVGALQLRTLGLNHIENILKK